MKNVLLLIKKELLSYFNSPIAYIVIIVFLIICGYFFTAPLFVINQATIRHFIELLPLFFLFFIPAITMRIFAEELKSGTIEIISTLPMYEYEILVAKYISSLLLISIILLITLIYPISLSIFGKLDWGSVIGSYVGAFFLCSMFSSVGVFTSILSKNQIVSFILCFLICFFLFVVGKLTTFMPAGIGSILNFIGIDSHFDNATRGIIDTRDIIYYLSFIFLFLYSSYAVFLNRKWR